MWQVYAASRTPKYAPPKWAYDLRATEPVSAAAHSVGLGTGGRAQALRAEFGLDGIDEVVAKRAEIRAANTCPEDVEQRAGVGEQDALLAVDPEQVQIPVVVGRREL